jgi:hypothetical protein
MSGLSRSLASALFCALLLTTVFLADAAACTCQYGGAPVCQDYWRTDLVFAGTVVGSAKITIGEGDNKYDRRLVRLEVAQIFRGELTAEAEVVTGWGGGDCGYRFNDGETYLVYASRSKQDQRLHTSICTRTRPISQAAEDLNYIRNLHSMDAGAVIFGKVNKHNYKAKEGEAFSLPVSSANLIDAVGQPVADLPLHIRGAPSDIRNINTFRKAKTNAEGRFEFDEPVPPGDYLLGFRILGSADGNILPYPRTYYPGVAFKSQASVISVKEGEHLSDIVLRLPPPLSEYSLQGFVVWSDGRPAPNEYIYLGLLEEGESSGTKTLQADERGHFTLKVYEGLNYKVSAYPRNASGAAPQSEWVDVPQTPEAKPIKLVLPALKK